ncbi:TetR family transcriptional regulator [Actinomycetospora lemnae]|uniref:TetR family transcriptional regulator n=1 Tax=Actinomycetospora lemnae TaxID=3019891 RepID=A0ABT5T351_9PSEU|nr:TetR family transcriptional regulator [Actinomycetospora sp. DW7H6]MDD7969396.1 TetR family transcriptional regulator [Actinomycetospora sp. DW7H6]
MPSSFAARTRGLVRDEALERAAELLVAGGWRGLRLQDVADGIGVSRQTLYNEFASKQGLAAALVLRRTEEFLGELEAALDGEDDLYRAWSSAVRTTLDTTARDPLLRVLLTGQGAEELLPLLTSEAEPLVAAARDRAADFLARRRPGLDAATATAAAEIAARLTISHIVLPLHPPDVVADQIATTVVRYLAAPT